MGGTEGRETGTAGIGVVSEEEVCGTDMIDVQGVGLPEQSLCFPPCTPSA